MGAWDNTSQRGNEGWGSGRQGVIEPTHCSVDYIVCEGISISFEKHLINLEVGNTSFVVSSLSGW